MQFDDAAMRLMLRRQAVARAVRTVERFCSWLARLSLVIPLPDDFQPAHLAAAAKLLREHELDLALEQELAAIAAAFVGQPDELAARTREAHDRAQRGLLLPLSGDL